jgi:arabinose-5-phosphate isomerase
MNAHDSMSLVARARAVVLSEIEGLSQLAETLDGSIASAANLIIESEGRVILTGVGKSGHIAAKLASTFASTGAPSFFLHATEAAHGDLGMVTQHDVVLAISNSGDTRELYPILDYCRERGIPLISITANADSRLGRQAAVLLKLPQVVEVCPNNLAPTTSAVVMLSIGHALAVLLMEMRAFAAVDFAQFHPGGRLGLLLSPVKRYVEEYRSEIPSVPPDAPVDVIIDRLANGRKGCIVVIDPTTERLQGIITEGDLRRAYAPDMFDKAAADIMSRTPATIEANDQMRAAVAIMKERRIANLIVLQEGKVIDVLHLKDLMQRGYL